MFVEEYSLGIGGILQYGCLWENHRVSKYKLPIYGRQKSNKQIVFRTNILNASSVFQKNVFIVSMFWTSIDVFLFSIVTNRLPSNEMRQTLCDVYLS